jgi:hypothetical protein
MRLLFIFLTGILTSFFFFPFEFTFLPGINTKMMLAVCGLVIALLKSVEKRAIAVPKEFFVASVIAVIFSMIGLYSITYNNTNDYTYTTYIVSMWVWMAAAYTVSQIITKVHGYISIRLVTNYLAGVCVAQCIIALLIDTVPSIKLIVDDYVAINTEVMEKIDRLYGIGALLDVAGIRFAATLLMIAVTVGNYSEVKSSKKMLAVYFAMFVVIAIVGSIIARTTSVGIPIAFAYVIYATGIWKIRIRNKDLKLWIVLIGIVGLLVLFAIYLYNNTEYVRGLLRFGFEGLINWIETGEWRTGSTDILNNMWILPETLKTWIIGDGYFMNPMAPGFYMKTDIGYLRFIYYSGLCGLVAFSMFFVYLARACYKKFPREKQLFVLLLALGFIVWVKVSTDIFLVYALLLCIPSSQKSSGDQLMEKI